uniref:Putative ovule protein n=1 Tax=Solanum chacoense TaxID=4108 RepID=A0A0V0IMH3_SOLCH
MRISGEHANCDLRTSTMIQLHHQLIVKLEIKIKFYVLRLVRKKGGLYLLLNQLTEGIGEVASCPVGESIKCIL